MDFVTSQSAALVPKAPDLARSAPNARKATHDVARQQASGEVGAYPDMATRAARQRRMYSRLVARTLPRFFCR